MKRDDVAVSHKVAEHGFVINPLRTVFYGLCTDCADKKVKEDE